MSIPMPKGHKELASVTVGNEYGHVPGHRFHDVEVLVSKRGETVRVAVAQVRGSAQGSYDEEHMRRECIGRGNSIRAAINDARSRAIACGIETEYLEQALCKAEDEAEEANTQ
jgi:hypothetical protein